MSKDPVLVSPLAPPSVQVLLVEDNPTSRIIVQRMLERLGCTVETAEDGLAALSLIEHDGHDLVVLDQQLPLLDGYEIVEYVRSGKLGPAVSSVTLLMLSGEAPDDERRTWLRERRVAHLTKPVTLATLNVIIAECRTHKMNARWT